MKQVEIRTTVFTDELSNEKGYVMMGRKGEFITARDTDGKYIWVRLNPTKADSKPVHSYPTLKDAVEDKINNGYEVFEYSDLEELAKEVA